MLVPNGTYHDLIEGPRHAAGDLLQSAQDHQGGDRQWQLARHRRHLSMVQSNVDPDGRDREARCDRVH